jgi:hypothetical protein
MHYGKKWFWQNNLDENCQNPCERGYIHQNEFKPFFFGE